MYVYKGAEDIEESDKVISNLRLLWFDLGFFTREPFKPLGLKRWCENSMALVVLAFLSEKL